MITKYSTLLLLVFGFMIPSKGQNPEMITLCSGETAELEVTTIFEGSVFEWSELTESGYTQLPETTNKLVVSEKTVEAVAKQYRCIYFFNEEPYDTSYFAISINPNPQIEIIADNLCEGQLANFRFNSNLEIKKQEWNLNNDYQSLITNPDYVCQTDDPVALSLKVISMAGCRAEVDTVFNVTSDVGGEIVKIPQVSENKFIEEVDCGNSVTVYEMENLEEGWEIVKWEITADGESILTVELEEGLDIDTEAGVINTENSWITSNTLKVRWENTTVSRKVVVTVTYSNGECEYETVLNTILINDNSPAEAEVFQKPNSTILILPAGITDPELNYMWGYTTPEGNENVVQADRHFVEFDELAEGNQYWVETWYVRNEFCRVRNFLNQFQPKSASEKLEMNIFPNPVGNWLKIELNSAGEGQIVITDLNGVPKKSLLVQGENVVKINMRDLRPGSYVVSFQDTKGNQLKTERVVVQ